MANKTEKERAEIMGYKPLQKVDSLLKWQMRHFNQNTRRHSNAKVLVQK